MFSDKTVKNLSGSSFIRAMFEEGEKLRRIHGPEKVYDFSLGNPDADPPESVMDAFKRYASGQFKGLHRYMSNAGYADVRAKIAGFITREQGVDLEDKHVVMTCGAAGGLNVILKSLLNPGEEVIVFSPYFVEYLFYIENSDGRPVIVPTDMTTFEPDAAVLEKSMTAKTKAIIINTPNNPTGAVYSEKTLRQIAAVLEKTENKYGTNIYVISDQPYDRIVYDGTVVPPVLGIFKNGLLANSFSKSHSLPGERIGYVAVSPAIKDVDMLINCLIFCNRTLGFVNAPSTLQKVVADTIGTGIDIAVYGAKRDLLYNHLISLGFSCIKPKGAFYLFPKSPIEDDTEFARKALDYNILVVPGRGFGCPGYFRIAYCVSLETIKASLPAFGLLAKECIGV